MKTVFIPPIVKWDFLKQLPQQMAQQFARNGYKVIFCSNNNYGDYGYIEVEPNLFVYKNADEAFDHVKKRKINVDIYYTTWAKTEKYINMVNPKYVIYHSCDSFDEWKPYEQKMINKSDVVFCTSEFIYNLRKKQHDNVHILRNACDKNMINSKWKVPKDLFKVILDDIFKYYKNKNELIEVLLAKVIEEDYSLKKILELDGIKKPDIFCMVGALGKWVDTTLIRAISEKYTTVFIGSEFGKRCPEDTLDLGVKKYSDLINYCNSCNVGLLPFRTSGLSKEITAAANPIKMWEYLACGLPVLATSWKETELPELKDVVFTAKTKEEYLKKADYLVNLPQEKYNEISKTAKKVASENTWEKRWNYMENIIGGMIN